LGGGGGVKTHQHYLSLWCDFFLVSSSIHFPFFRSRCSGNWIWIDEGLIMNFSARDFYISIASNSLPWSLYLQLTLYLAIANHLDLHLSDLHSVKWRWRRRWGRKGVRVYAVHVPIVWRYWDTHIFRLPFPKCNPNLKILCYFKLTSEMC